MFINHSFEVMHLWMNKLVKYQKFILIEEFCTVGINDFNQLINSDDQLKSYNEIANEYGMIANNTALI